MQRTRYLNAVNTFKELLSMGVVPIVNENDTVSVSVSRFISFSFRTGPDVTCSLGNQIRGQRYIICHNLINASC